MFAARIRAPVEKNQLFCGELHRFLFIYFGGFL